MGKKEQLSCWQYRDCFDEFNRKVFILEPTTHCLWFTKQTHCDITLVPAPSGGFHVNKGWGITHT